jgi:hypothetical protein
LEEIAAEFGDKIVLIEESDVNIEGIVIDNKVKNEHVETTKHGDSV